MALRKLLTNATREELKALNYLCNENSSFNVKGIQYKAYMVVMGNVDYFVVDVIDNRLPTRTFYGKTYDEITNVFGAYLDGLKEAVKK